MCVMDWQLCAFVAACMCVPACKHRLCVVCCVPPLARGAGGTPAESHDIILDAIAPSLPPRKSKGLVLVVLRKFQRSRLIKMMLKLVTPCSAMADRAVQCTSELPAAVLPSIEHGWMPGLGTKWDVDWLGLGGRVEGPPTPRVPCINQLEVGLPRFATLRRPRPVEPYLRAAVCRCEALYVPSLNWGGR